MTVVYHTFLILVVVLWYTFCMQREVIEDEETRLIQVRIDESLYKKLKASAEADHRSVSAQVRVAIERIVDTYQGPG